MLYLFRDSLGGTSPWFPLRLRRKHPLQKRNNYNILLHSLRPAYAFRKSDAAIRDSASALPPARAWASRRRLTIFLSYSIFGEEAPIAEGDWRGTTERFPSENPRNNYNPLLHSLRLIFRVNSHPCQILTMSLSRLPARRRDMGQEKRVLVDMAHS